MIRFDSSSRVRNAKLDRLASTPFRLARHCFTSDPTVILDPPYPLGLKIKAPIIPKIIAAETT